MAPVDFHMLLRARPFVPFRIITPEGTTYDVHHPELCMVGISSVIAGYPSPNDPATYDRADIVSMRHIYRLERIPPSGSQQPATGT